MIIAIDTETTGLDFYHGCRPFMVTACDGDLQTNYYWIGQVNPFTREVYWDEDDLHEIQQLINKAEKIIFHNAKFDIRALEFIGIDISPIWGKVEDNLLAAHCICSAGANKKQNEHGLKDLAIKYLDYWDDDELELQKEVLVQRKIAKENEWDIAVKGHPHFPASDASYKQDYWLAMDSCLKYGLGDVERTWLLWREFKKSMIIDGIYDVYKTRRRLLKICYEMEDRGMYMYVEKAKEFIEHRKTLMEKNRMLIKKICDIKYKFNPQAKQHLVDMLHTRLKIPVQFTTNKTGEAQMTKKSLDFYIGESSKSKDKKVKAAIKALRRYKQYAKDVADLEGYMLSCDENNRIHSTCWITGTRETRQSFTDPAIQTIKKALKKFYGPPPGYIWVNYDLVNIELRIWAYDTGNPDLIAAFERGESVHIMIGKIIAPQAVEEAPNQEDRINYKYLLDGDVNRFKSIVDKDGNERETETYTNLKSGTFGRIYGATNLTTNQTYYRTKSKEPPDACSLIDSRLPGVGEYSQRQIDSVLENFHKYNVCAIFTLGGYRLDVPSNELQKACNYRVQGTAGYITTLAMIAVYDSIWYQEFDCHMVQQVHDSIVVEMPIQKGMRMVIHGMQEAIEDAGSTLIPTCRASYKIMVNEADKNNPLLKEI